MSIMWAKYIDSKVLSKHGRGDFVLSCFLMSFWRLPLFQQMQNHDSTPNHQGPPRHLQSQGHSTTSPELSKRISGSVPSQQGTSPVSHGLSCPAFVDAIGPPSPLFVGCGLRPSGNARGIGHHQWKGLTVCVHDLSQILRSECIQNSNELEQCFLVNFYPFCSSIHGWRWMNGNFQKLESPRLWTRQLICMLYILEIIFVCCTKASTYINDSGA